jgi:hypothetical protein
VKKSDSNLRAIALVLASIEVGSVGVLTYLSLFHSGLWSIGLLCYFILQRFLGNSLGNILITGVLGLFLAISYLIWGLVGSLVAYLLAVLTFEVISRIRRGAKH